MKRCTDPDFQYTPSFETDLKKKFARIRKAQAEAQKQAEDNAREALEKVDQRLLRRKA